MHLVTDVLVNEFIQQVSVVFTVISGHFDDRKFILVNKCNSVVNKLDQTSHCLRSDYFKANVRRITQQKGIQGVQNCVS